MHTLLVMGGGFTMLLLSVLIGLQLGHLSCSLLTFVPIWFAVASFNMWVGVNKVGYAVTGEISIFLLIFTLPSLMAFVIW
ncbi:hypothetical protein [Chitinivorax sp. B]|uniref:hypothetical protein n=1 Tax=Chitinivorax sp. B TaxID=2502235 RepID=UPI0010F5AF10|nr:hypothetical protein [Chitinivorax sp. B]